MRFFPFIAVLPLDLKPYLWDNSFMQNFDIRRQPKKHSAPQKRMDPTVLHNEAKPFVPKQQAEGSFSYPQNQNPVKTRKLKKSHVLVSLAVVFLLTFSIFSFKLVGFARSISSNHQSFYKTVTDTLGAIVPGAGGLDQSGVAQAKRSQQRINILMLGYGGAKHEGSYLTDSIMLLSVDFKESKTSFISIPRDLWVKIPSGESNQTARYAKINEAFSSELLASGKFSKLSQDELQQGLLKGGESSKLAVSEVLGIPVDYFMSVDFDGFKEVVDILGGVEVDVENEFTDYTYPNGNNVNGPLCAAQGTATSYCRYRQVHFEKGLQTMDGEQALQYVRSRHALGAEGTDFARSKRQQRLLSAVQKKALSLNMAPKAFSVMNSLENHLQTDLSVADIKNLSEYLGNVNFESAERIGLDDSNFLIPAKSNDGQWILIPRKGISKYEEIHLFVRSKLIQQALPRSE
jgi:LCP family protein required for cell wall assembly